MKTPAIIVLSDRQMPLAQNIKNHLKISDIYGLKGRVLSSETLQFEGTMEQIASLFQEGRPIIGICASGILIRAVAHLIQDKTSEPPVIAIAEDGSCVVPLLGGHHGANDFACNIADAIGANACVTTAGDLALGLALDRPPTGWHLRNPQNAKRVMADILDGSPVKIDGQLPWIAGANLTKSDAATLTLTESVSITSPDSDIALAYNSRRLVIGIGCERNCDIKDLQTLFNKTMKKNSLAIESVSCLVSIDKKADEPAIHALAHELGVPARFMTLEQLQAVEAQLPNPSTVVKREMGVAGVAEASAIAALNGDGTLIVEKQKNAHATCAISLSPTIVDPKTIGRARGSLSVIGVGPGQTSWRSGEATWHLSNASDWVGYGLYLDLCDDLLTSQACHRFPLGEEIDRVRFALELAGEGKDVALICSGDPGIYAMAALVHEVRDRDGPHEPISDAASRVAITTCPGISAVQAASARIGAPLGHDFCLISLSDLLTPWEIIEKRTKGAADGDFVVAFYNPKSQRRTTQLAHAIDVLKSARPSQTPVIIGASIGRPEEKITVTTLADMDVEMVDMLSIVIVGSSTSKTLLENDRTKTVYTPRGYAVKSEDAPDKKRTAQQ